MVPQNSDKQANYSPEKIAVSCRVLFNKTSTYTDTLKFVH